MRYRFNPHTCHNPSCDIVEAHVTPQSFITYGVYVSGPRAGEEFMEFYQGPNYKPGSEVRNWSRCYSVDQIPKLWKSSWLKAKEAYTTQFKGLGAQTRVEIVL